jgi:outer membrane receptor for ferrienterochelin and colicins
MNTKMLLSVLLAFFLLPVFAQTTLKGRVTDKQTGQPLTGATVTVKGTSNSAVTDENGDFALGTSRPLPVTLVASYIGYADVSTQASGSPVNFELSVSTSLGDEVVVTASRRPQKITQAPASISVVTSKDFDQISSFNVGEMASKIQGVEFVRTGVTGVGFNARGFNNAFNAKILQMTDNRNSMMAGGSGLPVGIMNTVIKEDIDRFEVVLGPSSSLYGPNAHNGIANTITKDPRKFQGTTVVLGAGTQEVFSGRLRHAEKINDKFAYKVTGEYTSGLDFWFYDSVYAGGSVFGPPVAIPERANRNFRHVRGEGHLYYSVTPKSDIIVSYGGSTNRFLAVNNVGRNQIQDWKFSYLQARYVSPRFFAQVYNTWTNVGTSYGIPGYTRDFHNRTRSIITDPTNPLYPAFGRLTPEEAEAFALRLGNRFKEESRRLNAEAQYNYAFKDLGLDLVAGVSYQKDNPNTFGTSLADANQLIEIDQIGGVVQLEKTLPARFRLYGAARYDYHSVFGDLFAPKVGLMKDLDNGTFRVTLGKAYAAPIILFQSASVFGLVFGNGNGVNYTPNGSNLETVSVTQKLVPEQILTWEVGYKGKVSEKLYLDVNGYYGNSQNFLSPALTVGGRALSVGDIPIATNTLLIPGTVNPNTGTLSGAAFSTYFNYGEVASYGVDMGLNYYFNNNISLALKYSYFGSDITQDNIKNDANRDGFVSAEERSLNAPQNRVAGTLSFSNLAKGKMFLNLSGRWVEQFDFYSGNQIGTAAGQGSRGRVYGGEVNGTPRYYVKNFDWGPLGGFTTIDISAGYRFNPMLSFGAGISNLFDVEMREFVGSPVIGRLFTAEIKVHIPNAKQLKK